MNVNILHLHEARYKKCLRLAKASTQRKKTPGDRNLNLDDCVSYLYQAHLSLKVLQEWEDAADCLSKASTIMWRLEDKEEALVLLEQSAVIREKANPYDAIDTYSRCVAMSCETNKFGIAAKLQFRVGELYQIAKNYEEALEAFELAASLYEADMNNYEATKSRGMVAELAGILGLFDEAVDAFINLGFWCLKENLTKFNAPYYLYKAGLLLLAQGKTKILKKYVDEWIENDCRWAGSPERMFLSAMVELREGEGAPNINIRDNFADDIYDWDNSYKLDAWALMQLRRYRVFIDQSWEIAKINKARQDELDQAALEEKRKNASKFQIGELKSEYDRKPLPEGTVISPLNSDDENSDDEDGEEGDDKQKTQEKQEDKKEKSDKDQAEGEEREETVDEEVIQEEDDAEFDEEVNENSDEIDREDEKADIEEKNDEDNEQKLDTIKEEVGENEKGKTEEKKE